jgi:hypothetical protein
MDDEQTFVPVFASKDISDTGGAFDLAVTDIPDAYPGTTIILMDMDDPRRWRDGEGLAVGGGGVAGRAARLPKQRALTQQFRLERTEVVLLSDLPQRSLNCGASPWDSTPARLGRSGSQGHDSRERGSCLKLQVPPPTRTRTVAAEGTRDGGGWAAGRTRPDGREPGHRRPTLRSRFRESRTARLVTFLDAGLGWV